MKSLIIGKVTPNLKAIELRKNNLGFKFGSNLIALMIDAQAMAQEETINEVNQSKAAGYTIKFTSMNHFSLRRIDLSYNKLSHLVIQTVERLLKNLI